MEQEEVAGHADAHQGHTEAPTYRHAQHRQGDRHAPAPLHDVVQVRVGGVVVALDRAGEAQILEQVASPALQGRLGAAGGDVVDAPQLLVDVEVGVGVGGHQEGGLVEGQGILGTLHQPGETVGGVHGRTLPPLPYDASMATVSPSETPNPNATKYTLDVTLPKTMNFSNADAAADNPFAAAVFTCDGVASIFGVKDFVTITRKAGADWAPIHAAVEAAAAEHL